MPFDIHVFGRRLREARKDLKLSQEELGEKLGVSHGWISELENAKQTHVQADTAYRFCEALNVSADYLLGLTDDPTPARARRRRSRRSAEGVG